MTSGTTTAMNTPSPAPETTSFPKNRIGVTLLEGIHEEGVRLFERESFPVDAHTGAMTEDELVRALAEAHVVGIRSKTRITERVLDAAPRLLAIGCFCIGTNQVDLAAAAARGIPVFNAPFSNTRSVAELTIAEIVALYRRLGDRSAEMHRGEWNKSAKGAHEVRGRTLGIVGYGHIGTQVSVLAEAMGLRVLFYDHTPKLPLGNARPVGSLDELLAGADIVSLHVPATESTDRMIGREQIARMKPGAMLINNARGSVVDLDALADALDSGRLGGAALDVFPDEPKASGPGFVSAVQNKPNVLLTPHIGGSTAEAQAAIAVDVATKLVRFVNNGSTTGAVNVPEVDLPEQSRRGGAKRAHRVLHFHRNVPGVMSQINKALSDAGANVASQFLQTSGGLGYVVLDVDPSDTVTIRPALAGIGDTIRLRVLW